MPSNNWESLAEVTVSAKPDGIWTLLCEDLPDFKTLKIVSSGKWSYSDKFEANCSGNGHAASPIKSDRCIFPQAPIGALIGKFGGSNMGLADGPVFVIGSRCIYERPSDSKVPHPCLFATINDLLDGFEDNSGELNVSVMKSR
jgi:hypothetical protein